MLLQAEGLFKSWRGRPVVQDLDLGLDVGEVVALTGPNGAGKTTTLRMLSGTLCPDRGRVRVLGQDLDTARIKAQARLGVLPEGAPLYLDLTPMAQMLYAARLRGFNSHDARQEVFRAGALARVVGDLERPIAELSKGQRRRIALACALIGDPPVLLLDEPMDGLDPLERDALRWQIRALGASKAILVSTHDLADVEAVCTRALVMAEGRLLASGTPLGLATQLNELSFASAFHKIIRLAPGAASREVDP